MNFDELQALDYGVASRRRAGGWIVGATWAARAAALRICSICIRSRWSRRTSKTSGSAARYRSKPAASRSTGKQNGFDLSYIFDQALRWHATSINIKSTAIPAEWKAPFDEFQKKIGYRFVLRKLEYPRSVHPGQMAAFRMWWLNAGVAPVYRDYIMALEFHSSDAEQNHSYRCRNPQVAARRCGIRGLRSTCRTICQPGILSLAPGFARRAQSSHRPYA